VCTYVSELGVASVEVTSDAGTVYPIECAA